MPLHHYRGDTMILIDNNGQPLITCEYDGCKRDPIGCDHEGFKCHEHMIRDESIITG